MYRSPVIQGIAFNLIIIRLNGVMRGSTSTRSDESTIRTSRSSGTDRRRRTVLSTENATPLSTFRIVTDQNMDTVREKSNKYEELWKAGLHSPTEP